jgi:hypothetical protein
MRTALQTGGIGVLNLITFAKDGKLKTFLLAFACDIGKRLVYTAKRPLCFYNIGLYADMRKKQSSKITCRVLSQLSVVLLSLCNHLTPRLGLDASLVHPSSLPKHQHQHLRKLTFEPPSNANTNAECEQCLVMMLNLSHNEMRAPPFQATASQPCVTSYM